MVWGLLVFALVAFVQWSFVAGSPIRGLAPDLQQRYSNSKGEFSCLDGVGVVPFDAVNDDYCDCQDGSDEPGTSACQNGKFYCGNIGHQPRILASQFVDDGVCDCCDGSDEVQGCRNTCAELGAELRADIEKQLKVVEVGLKTREARIAEGVILRKSWEEELARITREVTNQKAVVEKLRAEKLEADRIQREEEEKQRALEDSLKTEADEESAAGNEGKKEGDLDTETAGNDGGGSGDSEGVAVGGVQDSDEEVGWKEAVEASAQDMFQDGNSGESELQPSQANMESEEEQSLGGSADGEDESVVSEEKDSIGSEQREAESQLESDSDPDDFDEGDQDNSDGVVYDPEEAYEMDAKDYDEGDNGDSPPPPTESGSVGFLERVSSLAARVKDSVFRKGSLKTKVERSPPKQKETQEQSALSKELNTAESELRSLESKLKDLNEKLARDHGPSGEYTTLDGQCVDVQVGKYGYHMCPFGEAKQTEGGGSTGLGSWDGFDESYNWMTFSGGRKCWSGPARSLNLQLLCGEKDEILNVEEPNMCEYVGVFKTPAFCSQKQADLLRAQLAQLGGAGQEKKDEL